MSNLSSQGVVFLSECPPHLLVSIPERILVHSIFCLLLPVCVWLGFDLMILTRHRRVLREPQCFLLKRHQVVVVTTLCVTVTNTDQCVPALHCYTVTPLSHNNGVWAGVPNFTKEPKPPQPPLLPHQSFCPGLLGYVRLLRRFFQSTILMKEAASAALQGSWQALLSSFYGHHCSLNISSCSPKKSSATYHR